MNTTLGKLVKMVKHNSGLAIFTLICIIALVIYGCDSTVKSILTDRKVTRAELHLELEQEVARLTLAAETAIANLDRQDAIKSKLFEIGIVVASGGTVNPVGIATSIIGLLGVGAVIDNKRKDNVITALKNSTT